MMMRFTSGVVLLLLLNYCKPVPPSTAQLKSEARQSYNKEGRCLALDMIVAGYTQQQFWRHKNRAKQRVEASAPIWKKVGNDRARRDTEDSALETNEGHGTHKWKQRYQSRGYLQPAYLAGFGDGLNYNGSNEWEIFHQVLNRVEQSANSLARDIKFSNDTTLSVRQTFKTALSKTGNDPLQAAGLLGATTVWDRWRAEDINYHNEGGRNQYTVLPHQMSPVGPGDQTGQIYHFWGYVGWVLSNQNLLNGAADAAFVTSAYEGLGNYMGNGKVDTDDLTVDSRAIEFSVGLRGTFNESEMFQPGKAAAAMAELNCGQQVAQQQSQIDRNIGMCKIWLETVGDKADAERIIPTLRQQRYKVMFHGESIDVCQNRARDDLKRYETFVTGTGGQPVNFAYWVYSPDTNREKTGMVSDLWDTASIRTAPETKLCQRANSNSGTCGSLKYECSRLYCNPSGADYISCNRAKEYTISLCMYQNRHCLSNGTNCVERPERFKDIPNRTSW